MKNIKKVLLFKAASLGDNLMGKYFFENIKAQFPDARYGVVVGSKSGMIKDLLKAYPWIEVIEVNRKHPLKLLQFIFSWWRTDISVIQYTKTKFSTPSKLIARLITKRGGLVGFEDSWPYNKYLFDILLETAMADKNPIHSTVEHERKALRTLGLTVPVKDLNLKFTENKKFLEKFNIKPEEYIVAHLFSGNKGRGLSPEYKLNLVKLMYEKFGALYKLVLTGGKEDREEIKEIEKFVPVLNLAGAVTIQELINVIHTARAVVSLDTGAGHIAAHLKKPLVILRTCLGRLWWMEDQYKNLPTVLCYENSCLKGHEYKDYPDCLNKIKAQDIVHALTVKISS
jgi:ADP-heptose:LPS heptosyltransferase